MQPVQLRLGFGEPTHPMGLLLSLAGVSVMVEAKDGTDADAIGYLSSVGVTPSPVNAGLRFPASQLPLLKNLPSRVSVITDATLASLWLLLINPSADGKPAELTVDIDGRMWLDWFDGTDDNQVPFPSDASAVLLTADVPFVATAEAFEALRASCQLPLLVGRARVNLDGFVEIFTSKPQLAESAPLPGLFRIDDTHLGLPLAYASHLDSAPGFTWDAPPPPPERGPRTLPAMPMALSGHATKDLRALVDSLARMRAQAIVWDSGLGRRVFALAAVESLDAWPLLVVCPPASMWVWQRHAEMFSKSISLSGADADIHVVTYHDLARRGAPCDPQSVIFDDVCDPEASSGASRAAAMRLGGLSDTYRIAISPTWPARDQDIVEVMALLRPAEFRPDVPIPARYPVNPSRRLAEHVACYLSRRTVSDPGLDSTEFRRSSVTTLLPSNSQRTALDDLLANENVPPAIRLTEAMEIVSAGTSFALSPKIAAAVSLATRAADRGSRVAILVRHRRTETILKGLLRSYGLTQIEADAARAQGVPPSRMVMIRFDLELPDVSWFDEVIVVDYPWSTLVLDSAVGSASREDGPSSVTILHLRGTIDDRLAILAARRREVSAVSPGGLPPDSSETAWLLSPRRPE